MKTVIDAVNEFKGEWSDKYGTCLWFYSGNEKYIFGNSSHSPNTVCTRDEFNKCVDELSKAEWMTKPAYTQAMADNGELPAVGVEVELEEDTKLFSCHYDEIYELKGGDRVIIVSVGLRPDNGAPLVTITNGKGFSTLNPDYIKPLTPVIKLTDGKAYQFDIEFVGTVCGVYYKGNHEFNGSEDNYEPEFCANIKLLTV
jgi:hypothetical protein